MTTKTKIYIMAVVLRGGDDLALETFPTRAAAEKRAIEWVNNPGNGFTIEVAETFEEACDYAREQDGEWITISEREVAHEVK